MVLRVSGPSETVPPLTPALLEADEVDAAGVEVSKRLDRVEGRDEVTVG